MIATGQVETHSVGELEVDLIDEPMSFSQFTECLLFLVLRSYWVDAFTLTRKYATWTGSGSGNPGQVIPPCGSSRYAAS